MSFGSRGWYRFPAALALSLFPNLLLAAEEAATSAATPSSAFASVVIQVAAAAFGILVLYVGFVTASFLLKVRKEAAQAKKDTPHQDVPDEGAAPASLSWTGWIALFFGLAAATTLFIVLVFLPSGLNLSLISKLSSWVVQAAAAAAVLLALYMMYSTVKALTWGRRSAEGHPPSAEGSFATPEGVPLNPEITRRSFLSLLGWAWVAFTAATLGALSTCLRFAFPNVTFEPPTKFKVGFPSQFGLGVDNRFKDQYRVWIVRDEEGFYALSTICTHLGCTPNWLSAELKFKCPCHGSGFYITGINFEGPAPRPLERFKIVMADDGQIEVDQSEKFQEEKGEWGKPGSFLTYKA